MPILRLAELTTTALSALNATSVVALVPVGATEAHGPHLPLGTDVIIAEAMCQAAAERLSAAGFSPVITPPLAFTAAGYAAGFAGTVSVRPETVTALIVDLARAWHATGSAPSHWPTLTWIPRTSARWSPPCASSRAR